MGTRLNLVGQKFGRLLVTANVASNSGRRKWACVCDCGKRVVVSTDNLRRGNSRSCGCWKIERLSKMRTTHGESNNYLHHIWDGIKQRCLNPKSTFYSEYGGRGIRICDEWKCDYSEFSRYIRENLGERPSPEYTIDRVNNNAGYTPGNLRWATPGEQSRNKRNNVIVEFGGKSAILQDWADSMGISRHALENRLLKWNMEDAMTKRVSDDKWHRNPRQLANATEPTEAVKDGEE